MKHPRHNPHHDHLVSRLFRGNHVPTEAEVWQKMSPAKRAMCYLLAVILIVSIAAMIMQPK